MSLYLFRKCEEKFSANLVKFSKAAEPGMSAEVRIGADECPSRTLTARQCRKPRENHNGTSVSLRRGGMCRRAWGTKGGEGWTSKVSVSREGIVEPTMGFVDSRRLKDVCIIM